MLEDNVSGVKQASVRQKNPSFVWMGWLGVALIALALVCFAWVFVFSEEEHASVPVWLMLLLGCGVFAVLWFLTDHGSTRRSSS